MDDTPKQRRKNRDSVTRSIVLLIIAAVICYRIATLDATKLTFSFTDLLSLILGLFSIAISVAFYFKAAETSNTFYDNTYKFTKDTSEILGRMEAGFGERLRHIDEGYAGLREYVKTPAAERKATQENIAEEKKEILQIEQARQKLLAELADKAKLEIAERQAFFESLAQKENELKAARRDIASLRQTLKMNSPITKNNDNNASLEMRRAIERYVRREHLAALIHLAEGKTSILSLRNAFLNYKERLPPELIDDLRQIGYATSDGALNTRGALWLRQLVLSDRENHNPTARQFRDRWKAGKTD